MLDLYIHKQKLKQLHNENSFKQLQVESLDFYSLFAGMHTAS